MSRQGGNLSVFKHEYRAYEGRVTPSWSRIGVLVRYGMSEAWSSRVTVGLLILAMLPMVVYLVLIYLANNPLARAIIMRGSSQILSINATFFLRMMASQCWLALVLTAWIAPRLVSFDLSDNALPILLSHPISRFGYVVGKIVALFSFLSLVTWIPCLLLFVYQGYTSPQPWMGANLRIVGGLFVGSIVWIALLSLLGLALSSWVKWRMVATGIIFAAVFVPAGVGGVISAILRTKWGFLLNLPVMMSELWQRLLGAPQIFHFHDDLPSGAIVTMLIFIGLVCGFMLNARIRAREVVRG
jgi:ABC-type transport system involved in multi-copper enzyme maturation permease subunit